MIARAAKPKLVGAVVEAIAAKVWLIAVCSTSLSLKSGVLLPSLAKQPLMLSCVPVGKGRLGMGGASD